MCNMTILFLSCVSCSVSLVDRAFSYQRRLWCSYPTVSPPSDGRWWCSWWSWRARSMSNRLLLTVEFNVTLLQELVGLVPIQRQIPMFGERRRICSGRWYNRLVSDPRWTMCHVLRYPWVISKARNKKINFNEIGGSHNRQQRQQRQLN